MLTKIELKEKAEDVVYNFVENNQFLDESGIVSEILNNFEIIEKPVAAYGDVVRVLNYRKKPSIWESGVVRALKYDGMKNDLSWKYTVVLDRKTEKGKNIILYVGDSGIKTY